jgi:DNA-binding IclR family transcriptional regulator
MKTDGSKLLPEDESSGIVKSADRTLDLFELLASWGREMSHTELAASLDIPKSSLTKLLKNLTVRGYIEFLPNTKGYKIGPTLTKLAQQANQVRSLITVAEPVLDDITRQTMESSALNQLKGDQVEVVATVLSPQRLMSHLKLGDMAPLYAVSGGKAILAFLPDAMREEYLQTVVFEKFTPKTIQSKKALIAQLNEIKRTGVAYSFEEYTQGIIGIGVPILSFAGFPLGSLNIAMPAVRHNKTTEATALAILASSADHIRRQYLPL